jgi:hypothetical protein
MPKPTSNQCKVRRFLVFAQRVLRLVLLVVEVVERLLRFFS